MAEKRFIARRITESDKIRTLANNGKLLATTLYAFLLPYLDTSGRMNANPLLLKGGLFEGYTFTVDELEEAIRDLARVGLIRLYSNGRFGHLIQYDKFLAKEGGFNTPHPKEPESELPGPNDAGSKPVINPAGSLEAAESPSSTGPEHSREEAGKKPGNVQGEVKVKREIEIEVKDLSADADDSPEPETPNTTFEALAEIWNAHSGNLRKVRDLEAAKNNPDLQRLAKAFLKRHGARAEELFTVGIAAVTTDPHWLGNRANPVKRSGAPYGLLNYLRHVEDKAEIAAELQATSSGPPTGRTLPARPWEEWDIAQHRETGVVEVINQVLPDGTARMQNGETWVLAECDRCNN